MLRLWLGAWVMLAVAGAGCGDDSARGPLPGSDSGSGADSGAGADAGTGIDGGTGSDAGTDGGPSCVDEDGDGYGEGCELGADCDDSNAGISPAAGETCNGADDDCDGVPDEDLVAPSCALTDGICAGATKSCGGDVGWLDCGATEYGDGWESDETTCDAVDNDCDGTTDEGCTCAPGTMQACGSDVGVCMAGTQTCTDAAEWGPCMGDVGPMGESCNGDDDDCDGTADEAADLTAPLCPLQVGVCAGSRRACTGAGGWGACAGTASYGASYEASEVACDGLDNDCDGVTDEGCDCLAGDTQPCGTDVGACTSGLQTCTAGTWGACAGEVTPVAETCNGMDDDCNGSVDDGVTGPICGLTAGVCSGSRQVCTGGAFAACGGTASYGASYEATETTCDGLDNDCDAVTDEGCACVVGTTQPCGSSVGACERGTQTCDASGWGVCAGGTGPAAETCNGADDDCNGTTDDGLTAPACALTAGVCAGRAQQCGGASGWLVCTAVDYGPSYVVDETGATSEALCDGLDNDCDGATDEGCTTGPLITAPYDLFWPAIYDQLIAFLATPDGNQDVFVYDGRTGLTQRLTTTAADEGRPDVYGQVVVYQRGTGAAARVVAYDLVTSTETTLTTARAELPRVYSSFVVWQDGRTGTDWDVFGHDLTDGSEYAFLASTANEVEPDMRGPNLVYSSDASGSFRVRVLDVTTATDTPQTTTATRPQGGAVMDWAVFAWSDARATVDPITVTSDWDIYGATLTAIGTDIPVTAALESQLLGGIDGAIYAWSDRRGGNWDIVVRPHGASEVILTSSSAAQADPAISGDIVVWEDNRLGSFDIYATRLTGAAAVATAGQIGINEILFDPPPGADPNGDGTASTTQDEMVELTNNTAVALDISGFTLADNVSVRHTFASGTVIPAGGAIVVFSGGTPAGTFGGVKVVTASSGSLQLNNDGDTLTLANGAAVITTATYAAGVADQSIVRSPEGTGALVAHGTATGSGGALYSPGTRTYGYGF